MKSLTSCERISRVFNHKEADRIPIYDDPWNSTISRWEKEGMPKGMDYVDFFDLDKIRTFGVDNSPQYTTKTIEETDVYHIYTTEWGATLKQWKHAASTPEFIDFTIKDPDTWKLAKEQMNYNADRINWKELEESYPKWTKEGAFIQFAGWFGFDITHSWVVGTERVLMALCENPEWLMDIFDTELTIQLKLFDMILDKGYKFHGIKWWDDMGFKKNQFFSINMYREILKPFHKRAIEWAHSRGIKAYLHSCGDINPFIPDLIEMGLDILNPIEVKAGMDPYYLKKTYGDKLSFHGGLNALLYTNPQELHNEIEKLIPAMKENGGFMFGSDHSVPDSVSLEEFGKIVARAKELGKY